LDGNRRLKVLKFFLGFIAGSVVVAAAAVIVIKDIINEKKQKFQKELNDEIQNIKDGREGK
jgi:hypothetical protein